MGGGCGMSKVASKRRVQHRPLVSVQAQTPARLNLYLSEELKSQLEEVAEASGFQSVRDLVKNSLRLAILAHKYRGDPEQGLYWKEGNQLSKIAFL